MEIEEKRKAVRDAVQRYRALGWSIFPVTANKKNPPLVKWKQYQDRHASDEEVTRWLKHSPDMNIGIVTGAQSGIVVLDFDKKEGRSIKEFTDKGMNIPPTPCVHTAHGGEHLFFKHPGHTINVSAGQLFGPGVDVRGDGGYVVAPPSFVDDEQGPGSYEWLVPPEEALADMPDWLLKRIQEHKGVSVPDTVQNTNSNWKYLFTSDIPEGSRNDSAASVAGGLINLYPGPEQANASAWPLLQQWNQKHCKPPLDEKELWSVFSSILAINVTKAKTKADSGEEEPQKARALNLVLKDENIDLFRDEDDTAYARVQVNGHKETWSCTSRKFKLWVTQKFLETYGEIPAAEAVNAALQVVEGIATFKGEEHKLYNRVARVNETAWYDLADKKNRAVRITKTGWEIINDPPTLFRRHRHQTAQAIPEDGGDVRTLLKFVNVREPEQQVLLLVYLVSCFISGFPHPVLYIYGQRGSAKTTLSKFLRRLVDPSRTEVLSMPKDTSEMAIQLSRHHLIFYENISHISQALSDMICIAVTGGSISKRQLYTDADDFLFNVQTNVGINGININVVQADLLQRCILMELPPMDEDVYIDEEKLHADFEKERPLILGAIFSAVAKAMELKPNINLERKPRMADFAEWGCAIAEALGYSQEEFLNAYGQKIDRQSDEALYASQEAQALIKFMSDRDYFEDTPTKLLHELRKILMEENDGFVSRFFPEQANALMMRLNKLKAELLAVDIRIHDGKSRGGRVVVVEKIKEKKVAQSVQNAPKLPETLFEKRKEDDLVDADDIPF